MLFGWLVDAMLFGALLFDALMFTLMLALPQAGYNFTTGAVNTKGKQVFSYDPAYRLCVSSMLPGGGGNGAGQGIWPA